MELDDRYYYQMKQRIGVTYQGLKRLKVNPRCKRFIRAMRNYHYEPLTMGRPARASRPKSGARTRREQPLRHRS
jgi:hypothetical protein